MKKAKSFDGKFEYKLFDCPFCGSEADMIYIGNEYTKKRTIEIKCLNKLCRAKQVNSAMRYNFPWLENVSVMAWNKRNKNEME